LVLTSSLFRITTFQGSGTNLNFFIVLMDSLGGGQLVLGFFTVKKKNVSSEMNAGFSPPCSYDVILLDGG
jgi:Na+-transporting NADH:ubiquinone oxidoreductase subunit NqrB